MTLVSGQEMLLKYYGLKILAGGMANLGIKKDGSQAHM